MLNEKVKVQVDRGTVNLPEDRKTLQEFGKIWKKVYEAMKTSPDQIPKYKGLIKKISDSATSGIDRLAGVFTFMGKKFNVEVDKSKYSQYAPTAWKIAYAGNLGESWLREIIREQINFILMEGGNIPGTNSLVPREDVEPTVSNALKLANLGGLSFSIVGNKNQPILGDVDSAVESKAVAKLIGAKTKEEFWEKLNDHLEKSKIKNFKVVKGITQFHLVAPLIDKKGNQQMAVIDRATGERGDEKGMVQLDFFVGDLKWMDKALSGVMDSKYKAVYRNLFLVDLLSQLSFKTKDPAIRKKLQINWKEGIEVVDFTFDEKGKRQKLKVKKVTGDMDKFAKFLFGAGASFKDIDSFEKLFKMFKSKKFHYPKLRKNILDAYKKTLKKHKLAPPKEVA